MALDDALRGYLETAGAQIRWRRARGPLLRELAAHVSDQADAYRGAGVPEDEALARAVGEMGDPAEVGRALNRLHRPRPCCGLALCVALLLAAGLALQYALLRQTPGAGGEFHRQLFGVLLGFGVLLLAWFSDYTRLCRGWTPALGIALLAAAAFLCAPLVTVSHRSMTLVCLPMLLPTAYAALLCQLRGRGRTTVLLCGIGALLLALPPLLSPSVSAALVTAGAMLLVLGAAVWTGWFSCKKWAGLLCAWGPAALALAWTAARLLTTHYASARLLAFFHPERDPLGAGYLYLGLRGGLDGFAVPDASRDLLLAYLARSAGPWVFAAAAGAAALLALVLGRRIHRLKSRSGKLLALSAFWVLLLQAVLYLLCNLGWCPVTPLSLPFFSYGMLYQIVDLALVGVLLSVFRMDALARDPAGTAWRGPIPPRSLELSLLRGSLRIEYHRRA